ncbi:5-oxoprolinase subunit PxpB [Veronia pacifica]|uniref:Carboxyltransferase domain-containing protein n=1 Tax=Veronia pacifica TaxID=1080227 RepID=A0A1C3EQW6_9GAMM|nr:5-oxoprolinase subunit PxpB [Veronia pacifica]ODA35589.1 hypothetical protein A8L45_02895 [Veronia pacifica]
MPTATIQHVNETSLIVYFDREPNTDTSTMVRRGFMAIEQHLSQYVLDMIPSYHSILVTFNPESISGSLLQTDIEKALEAAPFLGGAGANNRISIPVYYGPDVGWDIEDVADQCALSVSEVIQLHTTMAYRVLAVGFSPGFGYLGETDPRLSMPRKNTPRLSVPAGCVAISERQTAVYPSSSPGGWHIIGRTPMVMFDWQQSPPARLSVGDEVNFEPITKEEYIALGGQTDDA